MRRFAIYKSEITGKYYVKYPESQEKEITKAEYYSLLDDKQRLFEQFIDKKNPHRKP